MFQILKKLGFRLALLNLLNSAFFAGFFLIFLFLIDENHLDHFFVFNNIIGHFFKGMSSDQFFSIIFESFYYSPICLAIGVPLAGITYSISQSAQDRDISLLSYIRAIIKYGLQIAAYVLLMILLYRTVAALYVYFNGIDLWEILRPIRLLASIIGYVLVLLLMILGFLFLFPSCLLFSLHLIDGRNNFIQSILLTGESVSEHFLRYIFNMILIGGFWYLLNIPIIDFCEMYLNDKEQINIIMSSMQFFLVPLVLIFGMAALYHQYDKGDFD